MFVELDPTVQSCPVCQSPEFKRFDAVASDVEGHSCVHIVECGRCHFAWQYPLGRTETESVEHFDRNYRAQGKRLSEYFDPEKKCDIALLEVDFLSQLTLPGKKLLDIGAGAGIFAKVAAERGFCVTALDPALELERIAELPNLQGVRGTMSNLPPDETFDVITMWDVIEHLVTPLAIIDEAKKRLRTGGWLVLETGNYKSADRVQDGARHWMYQLDHRWYFSPESMEKILLDRGFSEVVHADRVLRPGWGGEAHFRGPSRMHFVRELLAHPTRAFTAFSTFSAMKQASGWPRAGVGIFTLAARI
ncbi:class I SAM-dependent methyltransferase [Thauera phenylacetica]|nr:class I SAM-dependent methyltransferase [Thauera phenylacetica]